MSDTSEVIGLIKQWLSLQSRPNRLRRYSRCPICDQAWWDDKEQHQFTCWVPILNRIKTGVDDG